jgi:hypothetical protein
LPLDIAGVQWSWVEQTDNTSALITFTPSKRINKLLITNNTFTAYGWRFDDMPSHVQFRNLYHTHGALACVRCARQLVLRDVR